LESASPILPYAAVTVSFLSQAAGSQATESTSAQTRSYALIGCAAEPQDRVATQTMPPYVRVFAPMIVWAARMTRNSKRKTSLDLHKRLRQMALLSSGPPQER
jgi:hypothetical protein